MWHLFVNRHFFFPSVSSSFFINFLSHFSFCPLLHIEFVSLLACLHFASLLWFPYSGNHRYLFHHLFFTSRKALIFFYSSFERQEVVVVEDNSSSRTDSILGGSSDGPPFPHPPPGERKQKVGEASTFEESFWKGCKSNFPPINVLLGSWGSC